MIKEDDSSVSSNSVPQHGHVDERGYTTNLSLRRPEVSGIGTQDLFPLFVP